MAAPAAASSRHGFLRLLAAAAVLAAFGLGAARAAGSSDDRAPLSVASLFPGPACPTTAEHGPCSPLADAHGKRPAHDEILAADQNRVESIQRRVSATAGRGKLTVQAYDKYGGAFAYCLPASSSGTGYLDFGPGSAGNNARLTPMLTDKGPTFYYVGMTGIRVGGQQVPIAESVFSTAGTLVDSGTVITRLPATAYTALSKAFATGMSASGYKTAPAYSILDTCYDFTGLSDVALPTVSLVFQGGACLDVDVSGIVYAISQAQVCLAFASNGDDESVAIVGNTQQKTYGVLYDLGKKTVGFAPGSC
uniref:Peptidase A1 domain-containing protein n=1 Tax=Aegilops tauschii subsp. strangulata TaxID=200361 RepID=A0A453SJ53_AEGTS